MGREHPFAESRYHPRGLTIPDTIGKASYEKTLLCTAMREGRRGYIPMKRQKKPKTASATPYLIRPRLYLGPELMLGPGKIALLKAVRDTGSISAAARTLQTWP
jgi:hypothetical protein